MEQHPSCLTRCALVYLLVIYCRFSPVILEDVAECSPRCWNPVQLNSGVSGATRPYVGTNEEECKALCINNGTCIGVDWFRITTECWFQLTELSPYNGTNVNHWSLANCTDECVSYCWKAVKVDFHVYWGTYVAVADENNCKLLCSNTSTCKGVDWNATSTSCWLIFNETLREAMKGIRHWDIIRNLPTRCQTTARTDIVISSAVNVSTASNTVTSVHEDTKYSKESSTEWKIATIVLAILLGLCILIIIGLVINTIRNGRILNTKSDDGKTEMNNYEGLQRTVTQDRSEDALYTDLVQGNPNNGRQTKN